jgi:hypothetical protein
MNVLRLLAASTLMTLSIGCSSSDKNAATRLADWNSLLSRELPTGSTKAEVESFFSRHGLESSASPVGDAVLAIDRDVASSGTVSTSITFRCQLNLDGKLASCKTAKAYTGP